VGTSTQKVAWGLQSAATYVREGDFAGADQAFTRIARQAHAQDLGNLEAEAYRSMALYQKDSAHAHDALAKAEAVLREPHQVPQALLDEELAAVWRTGSDRAVRDGDTARAKSLLQRLNELASANSDQVIEYARAGASGAVLLGSGRFAEAISDFQGDPTNPYSMLGLVQAYEKSGQKDNAVHMGASLAALNVPMIEQALVVPDFRKHQAERSVATEQQGTH
jgi:hypothetical protein